MAALSRQEMSLTIRIDSRLEQVPMVGYAVQGICARLGLGEIVVHQMELAVVEAVNNAIKHAYESAPGHPVEVSIAANREWIQFNICDEGKAFNFQREACFQYDPRDRQSVPEGGMGLQIMASVMDDMSYCSKEGRNCLLLCKRLA